MKKKSKRVQIPFTNKNTYKSNKKSIFRPLLGKEVKSIPPIIDNKTNNSFLEKIQFFTRGLGTRHLRRLVHFMKSIKTPHEIFHHVKISFLKFKFLQMLFPHQKKDLIWIFKNLLTLEGQKIYSEVYDTVLDVSYSTARWHLNYLCSDENRRNINSRLVSYFSSNAPEEWLPDSCFPPILFEKKRMYLAFEDKSEIDIKELRDILFKYIMELNVEELFIPPYDILFKMGNHLYNDNGVVKKDYEKSLKWNSGFLYQYFLAQPLRPREVWLPGKGVKNNNLFWMTICRQFLKKSKVYPSPDPIEVWKKIKDRLEIGIFRFDISGFGFQYDRSILSCMVSVIQELYPCQQMDDLASEFYTIMDSVTVDVGMRRLHPPRGIGLGYYEDLKTLAMLAILDRYDPISVYGDQGILPPTGFEAILELQKYNFLFIGTDKVECQSHEDVSLKWAGCRMTKTTINRTKDFLQPLLGAFFSRFHWERKTGLESFYYNQKDFYLYHYKSIKKAYYHFFGNEFFHGDLDLNFIDGGIDPISPIIIGGSKVFILQEYKRPYEEDFFEKPMVSPFYRKRGNIYPYKVSKNFQEKREEVYKKTPSKESDIYFYSNPRLSYNSRYQPQERIIPDWADLLYVLIYGSSTGNFTYGLDREKLLDIALAHSLSSDPLKAAARGGYQILDKVYSRFRPLSSEWVEAIDLIQKSSYRNLPFFKKDRLISSKYFL